MSLFKRGLRSPPPVETPEYCVAEAGIIMQGATGSLQSSRALAYFACPGICDGEPREIHSGESPIGYPDLTKEQLEQVAELAAAGIKAACFNCSLNPQNLVPDSLGPSDEVR